ncbi:hypothetical protein OBBRIDRAFT_789994 [Obba rivulosa]|uniref:choline-phosphate cytidylyltransferase n=1 Tax=Obba rivulosa TaxID=1052685 RepID=A0A8E2DQ05_9APHY|nr:hypothetical protein OBBRIDRAFT_789994 [Obba rivulosa]
MHAPPAMRRSIDASSVLSYDDLADYDVISDGPRSLESSIADLALADGPGPAHSRGSAHADAFYEPPPAPAARDAFDTAGLAPEEVQAYAQRALGGRKEAGTVRVYVDGAFDPLSVRDVLRLRQAKLSFPSAHVLAGVFADAACAAHGAPARATCLERAEIVRHCRWVDEVLPDAPWAVDEAWLGRWRIDYVAVDEGSSVDPACDRARLRGFDLAKSLGQALPVRRTTVRLPAPAASASQSGQEPNSRQGTIKGLPPALRKADGDGQPQHTQEAAPSERTDDPFEEPKLDEFGTGYGI